MATKETDPTNVQTGQLRTETAEMLGQPGPTASGPGSPTAPTNEKPHSMVCPGSLWPVGKAGT